MEIYSTHCLSDIMLSLPTMFYHRNLYYYRCIYILTGCFLASHLRYPRIQQVAIVLDELKAEIFGLEVEVAPYNDDISRVAGVFDELPHLVALSHSVGLVLVAFLVVLGVSLKIGQI